MNDEIILKVREGDEEAFRILAEQCLPIASLYIERYCRLYPNLVEKNELYQLSLFSLYNGVMKYDENRKASFSTFYSVLLEHDFLMFLRSMSADKNRSNLNALSLDGTIAETEGLYLVDALVNTYDEFDPKKESEKRILCEKIKEELEEFSPRDKEIFTFWTKGYSYREIAEQYGLNRKAVEYIIRKIRMHIRPSLKKWHE